MADRVQKRGFAVVDMAHDGNDRGARLQIALVILDVENAFFHIRFGNALDGVAEFGGDQLGEIGIDHIAGLHHLPFLHQVLDHIDRAFGHALRQFLNGDGFRQHNLAQNLFARLLRMGATHLFLAPAHGRKRAAALAAAVLVAGNRGYRQLAAATLAGALGARRGFRRGVGPQRLAARRSAFALTFAPRLAAARRFIIFFGRRARDRARTLCGPARLGVFARRQIGNDRRFGLGRRFLDGRRGRCGAGLGLFRFALGLFLGFELRPFLGNAGLFGLALAAFGVLGLALLRHYQRAAAGVHLTLGEIVQHIAALAVLAATVGIAPILAAIRLAAALAVLRARPRRLALGVVRRPVIVAAGLALARLGALRSRRARC